MSNPLPKKCCARDSLLDAAEKLFTKHGYASVSTREIAETAKVNLGSIQYYFGSKAQLFVDMARRMFAQHWDTEPMRAFLSHQASTKEDAARQIFRFINIFVDEIFHPKGPEVFRVMHREALNESSQDPEMFEVLVSSVLHEAIGPMDTQLRAYIRCVAGELTESEQQYVAQSIIGQCLYYFTNKPFVSRLRRIDYGEAPHFDDLVRHIARFSLRGLGCDANWVEAALKDCQVERFCG